MHRDGIGLPHLQSVHQALDRSLREKSKKYVTYVPKNAARHAEKYLDDAVERNKNKYRRLPPLSPLSLFQRVINLAQMCIPSLRAHHQTGGVQVGDALRRVPASVGGNGSSTGDPLLFYSRCFHSSRDTIAVADTERCLQAPHSFVCKVRCLCQRIVPSGGPGPRVGDGNGDGYWNFNGDGAGTVAITLTVTGTGMGTGTKAQDGDRSGNVSGNENEGSSADKNVTGV